MAPGLPETHVSGGPTPPAACTWRLTSLVNTGPRAHKGPPSQFAASDGPPLQPRFPAGAFGLLGIGWASPSWEQFQVAHSSAAVTATGKGALSRDVFLMQTP